MAPLSQETIARIKAYNFSPLAFKTEREATLMLQRLDKYRDLSSPGVAATIATSNLTHQKVQTRTQKLLTEQKRVNNSTVAQKDGKKRKKNAAEVIAVNSTVAQKDGKKRKKNAAEVIAVNSAVAQKDGKKRKTNAAEVIAVNSAVAQKDGKKRKKNAPVLPQYNNILANKLYGRGLSGVSQPGIGGNLVPPIKSNLSNYFGNYTSLGSILGGSTYNQSLSTLRGPDGKLPEKLRNISHQHIQHVSNEIMDENPNVHWDDIAGLTHAKKCVNEMAVLPLRRPDLFMGCRSPGRGLLLFGPPGTGKTMIGKAIAGEAKATFFYISASSLTSKWVGEGEKLVRALFGVASSRQPAVIFVDEIDSLLSKRKSDSTQHEAYRLLKTQFFIEMEGFASGNEQVLLVGATNRPQDLDEAARRRLSKRLYIPLPSSEARGSIVRNLLEKDGLFKLSDEEMDIICSLTDGYSGSDMKNLVKDASMGPIREALEQGLDIMELKKEDMRLVTLQDFKNSLQEIRPSVSPNELGAYEQGNKQFGSLPI